MNLNFRECWSMIMVMSGAFFKKKDEFAFFWKLLLRYELILLYVIELILLYVI